jgi:hypothetical protein
MRKAVGWTSKRTYGGRRGGIHVPVFKVGRETRLLRVQATRDGTEPVTTEKKG